MDNYYEIALAYELSVNVLEKISDERREMQVQLMNKIRDAFPKEGYNIFNTKFTMYQLPDSLNYIISFSAFFRSQGNLPMEDYVNARDVKDNIKSEIEDYFISVDCDFKQLNIKPLL